jgi:hypothetical protein
MVPPKRMKTHPQLHDAVTQVHYLEARSCENLKNRHPVYRVLEVGSFIAKEE